MTRTQNSKPDQCTICGSYLTVTEEYAGARCLDPAHWQAAGILNSTDFYPMARIMAEATAQYGRSSHHSRTHH